MSKARLAERAVFQYGALLARRILRAARFTAMCNKIDVKSVAKSGRDEILHGVRLSICRHPATIDEPNPFKCPPNVHIYWKDLATQ